MEKFTHNPNYRIKYPGKEAYVFCACKQNSFPTDSKDYKEREIIQGPVNSIFDRDHDEKPEEKEEKESLF